MAVPRLIVRLSELTKHRYARMRTEHYTMSSGRGCDFDLSCPAERPAKAKLLRKIT